MGTHLKNQNFSSGETEITALNDPDTGIGFSILHLRDGESKKIWTRGEWALLHLEGSIRCFVDGELFTNVRKSVFDDPPFSVHVSNKTHLSIQVESACEVALFQTANEKQFSSKVYLPADVGNEPRGKGLVDNASLRYVRTIFDNNNSDPNCELVLGEVVNFPGRWSSYPPHHHPHPEIYHYRFTDPKGWGHAELGDEVLKVRHGDTVKILNGVDHPQCAAPGYGMYYIWVIRHLPECRYTVPEFTSEHRWTMEGERKFWKPKELV